MWLARPGVMCQKFARKTTEEMPCQKYKPEKLSDSCLTRISCQKNVRQNVDRSSHKMSKVLSKRIWKTCHKIYQKEDQKNMPKRIKDMSKGMPENMSKRYVSNILKKGRKNVKT